MSVFSFNTKSENVNAAAPITIVNGNENSGNEQFTQVPSGVEVADIASGVWNSLPEYSCNNVLSGTNPFGTSCTYKLMWNKDKLFFAVSAKDRSWNDDDMIEIGVKYKNQNWGYLFATMAPWVATNGFGNGTITFIDFSADENTNVRSIYFAVDLIDKSVLHAGESLIMNVNYYDYGDRVNGNKQLYCRLQSGVAASGDPFQLFPLVGENNNGKEPVDNTPYQEVYDLYLPEQTTEYESDSPSESTYDSSETSSESPVESNSSSSTIESSEQPSEQTSEQSPTKKKGCKGSVDGGLGIISIMSLVALLLGKKKKG